MRIIVRTLNGEDINVVCDPEDTTEDLKKKIQEQEGISYLNQRMIYTGRGMENSRYLSDYNVQEGGIVHLVLRIVCNCWKFDFSRILRISKDTDGRNLNTVSGGEGWEEEFRKEVLQYFTEKTAPLKSQLPVRLEQAMERRRKKRILSELKECYEHRNLNLVSLRCLNPDDLFFWELVLLGPKDSCYKNGHFKFRIRFSIDHPFRPLKLFFHTRMFHPMFTKVGEMGVCCNPNESRFLQKDSHLRPCGVIPRAEWSPRIKLSQIIHLLVDNMQNIEENYDKNVIQENGNVVTKKPQQMMKNMIKPTFPKGRPLRLIQEGDMDQFYMVARDWTIRYAMAHRRPLCDEDERERIEFLVHSSTSSSGIIMKPFLMNVNFGGGGFDDCQKTVILKILLVL